ncbi:putative protease with the C-terminal PDZ domain [Synechococcus sp. PCC 7502]|uniref:M61 family metallopeptidase n=1 Tax=Synechococcus sp. PCC 7502 TaxID=1173263 RepID=UPI00029FCBDA|nr:M61 family metallopeptidase [Synechococcus sp. PCC 7502]AFY73028.1 putative protease with the C-terminal PDZ domain [Synechococcus sp. PCC 7502]
MSQPWQYVVSMPQPENHLFNVQLTISEWIEEFIDLHLPVWSPGSYLVREYAKHLQNFNAINLDGKNLNWQKITKNHWRVHTSKQPCQISYQIFAHELTVRTNHLDASHGYFNGAATFMFVPHHEDHSFTVEIVLPSENWQIATALPHFEYQPSVFFADRYDTLADSPFEIGIHTQVKFEVQGKPHELIIWGEGNLDMAQVETDTKAIITTEADLFGGLPYDHYVFILHLSNAYGGLEHRNCCSLIYPRFNFRGDQYLKFMNLVAHEFFHTWNVKRIRPKALEKYDYDQENYTTSLWFAEGATSYYDQIIPLRARVYGKEQFLKNLGETITRLQNTPGRQVQSLYESSFDTWIKLYRPDANSPNSQISYYLKGELVSLLLDLAIRISSNHARSLDDVMRSLWQKFGNPDGNLNSEAEIGYTEADLYEVIATVAGSNLQDFLEKHIYTTDELDYNYYFEPFGIELYSGYAQKSVYTGISVRSNNGTAVVKSVDANSPAQLVGIDPNDEILAINNFRVTPESFSDRLQDFQANTEITITLFKQDQLKQVLLKLENPRCDRFLVSQIKKPNLIQQENLRGWLGE